MEGRTGYCHPVTSSGDELRYWHGQWVTVAGRPEHEKHVVSDAYRGPDGVRLLVRYKDECDWVFASETYPTDPNPEDLA